MGSRFISKFPLSLFLLTFLLYLGSAKPAQALEEGDCFNTTTVVVTGSITDVSGISEINVTVDSSPPAAFDYGSGNWTATFTGLGDGPHTLVVVGTDACGSGNTTTTDPLGFEVDTEAPTDLAADPAGGSYCATPVTVSISVSEGTIYYTLDGSEPTTGSPVYTGPINISVDTTLKFMAVDACGNQSDTAIEVYDIDTEAVVSITYPVNGVTIGTGDVRVIGTADDDISSVSLSVTQGTWTDTNPVVSGGAWSSTLQDLVVGAVTITITGTDGCGNIGSDSVTVPVAYLPPCDWFVDDDATGAGTGLSWTDAFTVVQDAVDVAMSGEIICVAEGIYTSGTTEPVLTMKNGVEIYGGFVGTESNPSERVDPATHPTILDGEDTSYHVVVGASNARLDGFTITGGYTSLMDCGLPEIMEECKGGGMYNNNKTSLVVANCTFSNNFGFVAAGMYNWFSSPTISNCIFSDNGTNIGGGMLNDNSSPTITDCTFSGNGAFIGGGGICNFNSSPTITNCAFIGNSDSFGGGMDNGDSSPEITNCAFISNWAAEGAGMSNYNSSPIITNCTFNGNSAPGPGGGMINNEGSSPMITNCIMWDDDPDEIYNDFSSIAIVTFSDIDQSGYAGSNGNIREDPLFVAGLRGDYYLSQPPGQVSTSPCVDAGNDTAANLGMDDKTTSTNGDLDTGIVDMGYHYQP